MNIKMRTDINKNALLVSLIVACEKALDDNPIFEFVEGEGHHISDTLVEIRERELTKAQIEVFTAKKFLTQYYLLEMPKKCKIL